MSPEDLHHLHHLRSVSGSARWAAFMALVEYLAKHPEQRLGQAIALAFKAPIKQEGFVIRYEDEGEGYTFNQRIGFPVPLGEATVYPTREEAQEVVEQIFGVEGIHELRMLEVPQPEFFYASDEELSARVTARSST